MAIIKPFKEAPWFEIDEDAYLMYLLKGCEILLSSGGEYVYFVLDESLHRDDGPAVIWNDGGVEYWQNDKLHREDGPAVIDKDGSVRYWLNNIKYYSEEEYYEKLKETS